MLVLNANQEQKQVFNRLIQKMDAQVVWDGRFIIMGGRLILGGFVRSLFFHFDICQTEVKLADLPDDEEEELEISDYQGLADLIAMAVYVFGKWGILKGVRVEQDIPQLNQMLQDILRVYQIDVDFSDDYIHFTKAGTFLTYEDAAETVIAYEKEAKENLNLEVQEPKLKLSEIILEEDAASDAAEADTRDSQAVAERLGKYHARIGVLDRLSDFQKKALLRDIKNDKLLNEKEKEELVYPIQDYERQLKLYAEQEPAQKPSAAGRQKNSSRQENEGGRQENGSGRQENSSSRRTNAASPVRDNQAVQERIAKYHARIGVLDRLSGLQKKALLRDIRNDALLNEKEKEELVYPIQDFEYQEKMHALDMALADSSNRTCAYIRKELQKIGEEELFEKTKQDVTARLHDLLMQYGIQEVRGIMENTPQHVERAEYQELMERLAPYEDIDLGPYKEKLRKMRETLEIKEISNLLMQSEKRDRKDYMALLRQIEERNYAQENASPYIEQILEWVSELDEEKLKGLLANAGSMDMETAVTVFDRIRRESFLPKLKEGALAVISRRLDDLTLADCCKLVRAFEKTMEDAIKKHPGHHFYPAEKILLKTVTPQEVMLIDNAVSAYAEKRGRFEYPVLMVDVSKEGDGRDGMLLTPLHLFYSTRFSGYRIPVTAVRSVRISSGLLNRRTIVAEEINGVKHKLPYAVEEDQLQAWADLLWRFIQYLQKRKETRILSVLPGQEDSGAAICSRCGCVSRDLERCPECGNIL